MNQEVYLQLNVPKFEFIDTQLNSEATFSPRTESNHQYLLNALRKQTCPSISTSALGHTKTEPPDPLDFSEIKTEPNTLAFGYISEIKVEENYIKQEVCDVGDHSYASVSKIEHSYAKIREGDLETIEKPVKVQKNKNTSLINDSETVANKENNVIIIEHGEFEDVPEIKFKTVENQTEGPQNVGEKHEWQVDLEAHLREIYLNDGNVPASHDLKPLESVPVIDLLSDSADSDDKTEVPEQTEDKSKINLPEQDVDKKLKCSSEPLIKTHLKTHARRKSQTHSGKMLYQSKFGARRREILNSCTRCKYTNPHTRAQTREKPFNCTQCPYSGKYMYNLIIHLEAHADELPYVCKICHYRTKDERSLMHHQEIHESSLNCRLCGFTTDKTLTMENHMVKYARRKSYRCYQCDFVTWYVNELVLHKRSHLDTVRCNVCREEMSGKAYETHRKIHSVICKECDFMAADGEALKAHTMTVHPVKTFRCAACKYVTNNKKELPVHMETHFGEKPYKCTKCDYSSLTSSPLRIHMRTHTNNVPYKCNKCSYATSFSCELLAHVNTHTEHLLKLINVNPKSDTKSPSIVARPKEPELLKIRKDKKYFNCGSCDFRCETPAELDGHLQDHVHYECFKCGSDESAPIALQTHVRKKFKFTSNHGVSSVNRKSKQNNAVKVVQKCRNCDYSCEDRREMQRHSKMHVLEKPYKFRVYDCAGQSRFGRKGRNFKCSEEKVQEHAANCDH